jgi:hypothetical protein
MNVNKKIYLLCYKAIQMIRDNAPKDTGNLAFNSVVYNNNGVYGIEFRISIDQNIAPYMVYTNEKWTSPRWNGKPNPNESWWNGTCEQIINMFERELGGELTQNDTTEAISKPT